MRRLGATAAATPSEAAGLAPFDISLEVTGNPRGLQVRQRARAITPATAGFQFVRVGVAGARGGGGVHQSAGGARASGFERVMPSRTGVTSMGRRGTSGALRTPPPIDRPRVLLWKSMFIG